MLVVGSHGSGRRRPLDDARAFAVVVDEKTLGTDVVARPFRIHRRINDALDVPASPGLPDHPEVDPDDALLSVGGVTVDDDGALVVGLEAPPSGEGTPILVRLELDAEESERIELPGPTGDAVVDLAWTAGAVQALVGDALLDRRGRAGGFRGVEHWSGASDEPLAGAGRGELVGMWPTDDGTVYLRQRRRKVEISLPGE